MARIVIASDFGAPLEVEQSAYDAGFFPGYIFVGPAPGGAPIQFDPYMDAAAAAAAQYGTQLPAALRATLGLSIIATVSASATLAVGKFTPVDATAAARTMTLPTGAGDGVTIGVEKVDASANAVSVTGNIRGVGSSTITLPWQHETLLLRADSAGSWWPVAGHKTKAALDAAYVTQTDRTARDRRAIPPKWDLAVDGLAGAQISSGLTVTSGYLAASVGGTDGTATVPLWGPRGDLRASARVKVTKGTASSKSYVGWTVTAPGTAPSSGTFTFGVGYLAGTGICIIRENVGAATVMVADASLTDGDLYDISIQSDRTLGTASGGGNGTIAAYAKSVATGVESLGNVSFNLVNFATGNAMARTNVAAGGLTNLVITGSGAGALGTNGVRTAGEFNYGTGSEVGFVHLPANPNGKLVLALHGHGGTEFETGWQSTNYHPTWDALVGAGFTVAVPNLGGNLWGNPTAQGYLASLYNLLVGSYGLDPQCYLWGNSMGGGAALTAVALKTVPVRAAYLAEPITDLSQLWANGSFTTLPAAYSNSTALRDASNPITQPASAYAGVPLLFLASASDTTAVKSVQTDAMRTYLGSATTTYLITATGNHNDPSHFRAQDTVNFFRANL